MKQIKTMTKDEPETPINGKSPQSSSKRIPKFWPGKPDNIQDLIHSKMKKKLGKINTLSLDFSKYFTDKANIPKYNDR